MMQMGGILQTELEEIKGILINLGTSIGAVMLVYGGIKFAIDFC